jgi:3-oxoacyl-[acyl-carrier protein] reductase
MFNGKTALVTGSTSGIGLGIATALAAKGANIVLNGFGDAAEIEKLRAKLAAEHGVKVRYDGADLSQQDAIESMMGNAIEAFGAVDILINNAGTLDHVGQFHDQRPELWERDLRVNLTGAFNCAQAVWPHMKERQWGRIVNMASVAGTLGGFGQASYSTTKAGILGLTRTLAMEGGRHGITCNAIVPGIIGTEAFHMANAAMNERIANRTVFKRPGEPQDIANAIAFLCSDLAAYVTGIELNVSGGVELFVF